MIRSISTIIITILLFSACSNHVSLVKRRYTKGYYVSHSGKQTVSKKETAVAKSSLLKKPTETSIDRTPEILVNSSEVNKSYEFQANKKVDNKTQQSAESSVKPIVTAQAENSPATTNAAISFQKRMLKPLNNLGAKESDSDAKFLVLVILCFLWFLNLIAIYIKDGHQITLNFWITLILNFTYVGGVIFALLVVLDVVDLG